MKNLLINRALVAKKKLFTLFLAIAASVGTMFAWDYEQVQIGDLYYNLDADHKTAEVTSSSGGYYAGDIVIPECAIYNAQNYNVTSIGEYAFYDCYGLTSVTIPNGVISIGEYAFQGCDGLTSPVYNAHIFAYMPTSYSGAYTIPDGIESIASRAFNGCDGLTSITIPNSVTSIGGSSFSVCTSLTSVTIPNGVTSIGGSAFESCTSLTSVTIPNSVTSIGKNAFCGCAGLTSVDIPNSVDSIGKVAFGYCSSLISINVDSNNQNYCAVDGVLFNKTKTTLIQYPGGKQGGYAIPNSVTGIQDFAFYYCPGLTSVTIPNSVDLIGENAFAYCTSLTSVTIPNSVTNIRLAAFLYCPSLTSVTISNSVDSIGEGAFAYCTGLTSVTCQATTPPTMSKEVFYEVDYSKIPLYVPAKSLDAYKVAEQWKDFGSISPISAKDTETNDVSTTATENSVEVAWPQVVGAFTYELVIKDKSGNVVCTLIFNAQGQLISIAFNAPSRDGAPQHKQDAGFSFVVNGLDSGTEYNYDVIAKDENGNVLDAKSGSFTTQAPQGIDDINAATKSQKIVHEGQILILRGEHIYDIQGKNIK